MKNCLFTIVLIIMWAIFLMPKPTVAQTKPYLPEHLIENEKQAFQRMLSAYNHERSRTTAASNDFSVYYYRCEWKIDPNIRYIAGKVTAFFTLSATADHITFDLSDTLTIDSISFHGHTLSFQRPGNDALQLQFAQVMVAGQKDSVSIYYQGSPRIAPASNSFFQDMHAGVPVIWTLSEPFGAKEWRPCKNGLDDKADSLDIFLTSPLAYTCVSNGVLISETPDGTNKITHYKHRYPIASYLLGIAISNYITDTDTLQLGGKKMPVIMHAYPENRSDFAYATYTAEQCLPVFSELFGEYPFIDEHYAQTQCNFGGGMEHQTNSFIGNNYNQLVAHELMHQWFGDKVTCGSWQHIWLNEGFANYAQFLYVQHFDTSLIMAHLSYYQNLITAKPDGSVFVPDTATAKRIFDSRLTYAKGGYVVHMLRGILGDAVFFAGIRQYLNDPIVKNKFALTEDLERNLEQASGKNLQSFFKKWIYGEGYPNYNCVWTQNNNNWAKVQIGQTTSHPSVSFYDMPVQLEFRNTTRDTVITVNHQLNGETFWLNPGFKADTMLLDPAYWILAKDRTVKKLPAYSTIENDIKIYPNPARKDLTILMLNPSRTQISLQLYNAAGQIVYTKAKALTGRDEAVTIPVTQLAGGVYILKIADNQIIQTKKILVSK